MRAANLSFLFSNGNADIKGNHPEPYLLNEGTEHTEVQNRSLTFLLLGHEEIFGIETWNRTEQGMRLSDYRDDALCSKEAAS